jgi:hypothetical protein
MAWLGFSHSFKLSELVLASGVVSFTYKIMYSFVFLFGGFIWLKKEKKDIGLGA